MNSRFQTEVKERVEIKIDVSVCVCVCRLWPLKGPHSNGTLIAISKASAQVLLSDDIFYPKSNSNHQSNNFRAGVGEKTKPR